MLHPTPCRPALRPFLPALLLAGVTALAAPAAAEDGAGDGSTFQVGLGGGAGWLSDTPQDLDLTFGGQLDGSLRLDLGLLRLEGTARLLRLERPAQFQVQGAGRAVFVLVQDATYRRTEGGELLRVLAGFGPEIGLPADSGWLQLGFGFALLWQGGDNDNRVRREAYGAYLGAAWHLALGPVVSDLRVAGHVVTTLPELTGLDFDLSDLFEFRIGVTAQERFFLELLTVGPLRLGPELMLQYEDLIEGRVLLGTLGLRGILGV